MWMGMNWLTEMIMKWKQVIIRKTMNMRFSSFERSDSENFEEEYTEKSKYF